MNAYMPCGRCGASGAQRMNFTWWGGIIGPRMLNHVRCPACGHQYNGKTGRSNTNNIIIYSIGAAVIGIGILALIVIAVVAAAIIAGN